MYFIVEKGVGVWGHSPCSLQGAIDDANYWLTNQLTIKGQPYPKLERKDLKYSKYDCYELEFYVKEFEEPTCQFVIDEIESFCSDFTNKDLAKYFREQYVG